MVGGPGLFADEPFFVCLFVFFHPVFTLKLKTNLEMSKLLFYLDILVIKQFVFVDNH